jgi:hypothetical protein
LEKCETRKIVAKKAVGNINPTAFAMASQQKEIQKKHSLSGKALLLSFFTAFGVQSSKT